MVTGYSAKNWSSLDWPCPLLPAALPLLPARRLLRTGMSWGLISRLGSANLPPSLVTHADRQRGSARGQMQKISAGKFHGLPLCNVGDATLYSALILAARITFAHLAVS